MILQEVGPLKPFPGGSKSLQILHITEDHWIAASTVDYTTEEEIIQSIPLYLQK